MAYKIREVKITNRNASVDLVEGIGIRSKKVELCSVVIDGRALFNNPDHRVVEARFKNDVYERQLRLVLSANDAVELALAMLECAVDDDQKLQGRLFCALPTLAELINPTT